MGFYIQTPHDRGKAKQLIDRHGAVRLDLPPANVSDCPSDSLIVCVVENRSLGFDASGIIYSQEELVRFSDPRDARPKTWLILKRDVVFDLVPLVESEMEY